MWSLTDLNRFNRSKLAFLMIMGTVFVALANSQAQTLSDLPLEAAVFDQKPDRLYDFYLNEIQNLTTEQIKNLNRQFSDQLRSFIPAENSHRAQAIDDQSLQQMLHVARNHPVVGLDVKELYSQPGIETGYCFGRAMYLHLLALKMGIQKDSIKKIWAVGPISSYSPEITWGYHVATMIFSKDSGWVVLDSNEPRPQGFEEWVKRFTEKSLDQRVRFYLTEPEKFGLYAGKYTRAILGLDLTIGEDWYKHYFVNMLASIRSETLQSLGLQSISPQEGKYNPKAESIN